MAANGERRQPRRTKQHNFPIAHFYENLIRTTGTRGSIHNDNNNESIDSTSPTVQLSIASRRERFQSTKMNATMKRSTSNVSSAITRQISNKNRMSPNEIIPQNTNSARQRRMSSSANPAPKMHPAISSGNNSRFKEIKPWSRDKFAVNSKAPTGERLSIYERSQLQLKEREKKIENLRQELYQECTFQPKRSQASSEAKSNYSRRTRHHLAPITNTSSFGTARKIDASNRKKLGKSPTTCASSTPGSTQATTPTTTSTTRQCRQDPQRKQQLSSTGSKDGTFVSRMSSTVKSLRFEELYQEGVRKFRQRPATEQEEQEQRNRRLEEEQMRECTFRPKLYWANKVSTTKRKPIVDVCSQGSSCKFTASKPREQSRSLSPYRETVSDSRQIASRRMAAAAKRMSTMKAPVRQIPIKGIPPADSDDNNEEPHQDMSSELSLLRKHHGIIRGRNAARQEEERRRRRRQQSRFPHPPLPREIEIKASLRRRTTTTTGMDSPIRKRWGLGPRRRDEESISPLRIPNELATRHLETSPLAPRIIFCGTTVGGESETTQTQMTEYGSI